MSLLRKILDSVFSCIINSRIVQDRKRRKQAIKEEEGMKAFFSGAFLPGPLEGLKPYPEKMFPAWKETDFNVYYIFFLLDNSLVPDFLSLIEEIFPIALGEEEHKLLAGNTEKERIICTWERKYGGMEYEIHTNSPRFIRRLDELRPQPPLPWVTLPDVEDMDVEFFTPRCLDELCHHTTNVYYWCTRWFAFWDSLTFREKHVFLNQHREAHKHWTDFIKWYDDP
jgi:hypothetical protein